MNVRTSYLGGGPNFTGPFGFVNATTSGIELALPHANDPAFPTLPAELSTMRLHLHVP
jgi:hypothetical protein